MEDPRKARSRGRRGRGWIKGNKEKSYWTVVFWKNGSRIWVPLGTAARKPRPQPIPLSRDEKQSRSIGRQADGGRADVAIGSNNTHCPAYHFHDFPSVDFQPRKTSFGATDEYRSSIFTTAAIPAPSRFSLVDRSSGWNEHNAFCFSSSTPIDAEIRHPRTIHFFYQLFNLPSCLQKSVYFTTATVCACTPPYPFAPAVFSSARFREMFECSLGTSSNHFNQKGSGEYGSSLNSNACWCPWIYQ